MYINIYYVTNSANMSSNFYTYCIAVCLPARLHTAQCFVAF